MQIINRYRSIPEFIIFIDVKFPGLVGFELFNLSKVQVNIILGSGVTRPHVKCQRFAGINWCDSGFHDRRWWLVNILSIGVDCERGTYYFRENEVNGLPDTIINIIFVPNEETYI